MTVNDRRAWTEVTGKKVTIAEGTVTDVHARAQIAAMRLNVPWWRVSELRGGTWVEADEPRRRNLCYRSRSSFDPLHLIDGGDFARTL